MEICLAIVSEHTHDNTEFGKSLANGPRVLKKKKKMRKELTFLLAHSYLILSRSWILFTRIFFQKTFHFLNLFHALEKSHFLQAVAVVARADFLQPFHLKHLGGESQEATLWRLFTALSLRLVNQDTVTAVQGSLLWAIKKTKQRNF